MEEKKWNTAVISDLQVYHFWKIGRTWKSDVDVRIANFVLQIKKDYFLMAIFFIEK
jgi:hypothetical protein